MKKIQKKLALKKKTISKLNKEQMNKVIGGWCTDTCCTFCGQYGYNCMSS